MLVQRVRTMVVRLTTQNEPVVFDVVALNLLYFIVKRNKTVNSLTVPVPFFSPPQRIRTIGCPTYLFIAKLWRPTHSGLRPSCVGGSAQALRASTEPPVGEVNP